jgi:hypothetical protein
MKGNAAETLRRQTEHGIRQLPRSFCARAPPPGAAPATMPPEAQPIQDHVQKGKPSATF